MFDPNSAERFASSVRILKREGEVNLTNVKFIYYMKKESYNVNEG